jgi:hypothetical protein
MRKTINIPDQIHNWYEKKAKELNIPTSAMMIIALNDYIKQDYAIVSMPGMIEEMKRIKEVKDELPQA